MAGPLYTPLFLLTALTLTLAVSPKRNSREGEPHLDCIQWEANIKEENLQEVLNFVDKRPREPQSCITGVGGTPTSRSWLG